MRYFTALLFVALAACATAGTLYEKHIVVRLQYSDEVSFWLRQAVSTLDLEVWAESAGAMDVRVPPEQRNAVLERLQRKGIKTTVMIEDVQKLINDQLSDIARHERPEGKTIDSTSYRDFNTLMTELDELEQDFPTLASSYVVSSTYEGRPIRVAKISSGGSDSRPVVWVDCGIHAREWVSHATCMYFLDQLTSLYGIDADITQLVDTYDFHILPVTNPDGYAHTWDQERLWRKNRVPYGLCYGVDCNRNFDSNFGGSGSSDAPCSDLYHGPSAFSEAESAAIKAAAEALASRLVGFFSIHSYSQYWMTPYGYKFDLPAEYDEMLRVSAIGVQALTAVHGTQYVYGNIADVIYVASGGSIDWVYDDLGVVYTFALELRDTGTFGFLLPAAQIIPTGEETLAGVVAAIQAFN